LTAFGARRQSMTYRSRASARKTGAGIWRRIYAYGTPHWFPVRVSGALDFAASTQYPVWQYLHRGTCNASRVIEVFHVCIVCVNPDRCQDTPVSV